MKPTPICGFSCAVFLKQGSIPEWVPTSSPGCTRVMQTLEEPFFLIPQRGQRRSVGSVKDLESPSIFHVSPCVQKHGAHDRSRSPHRLPSMS